ncbi:MAG TPA: hypothetical protein VFV66_26555 [Nonomuraea sp.]|nr:hypothetical protein [Nonomuraea sp.]
MESTIPATTLATTLAATPAVTIENGATQPVFSRAEAVKQTVFVEVAGTDSDVDGKPDRVALPALHTLQNKLAAEPFDGYYCPDHQDPAAPGGGPPAG